MIDMGKAILYIFVIICSYWLISVATGNMTVDQCNENIANLTNETIHHEIPFSIIDAIVK